MNKNPIIRCIACVTATILLLFTGCTKELNEPAGRNDGKMRISFFTPMITDDVVMSPTAGKETTQPSTRAALAENTTVRVVAYVAESTTYVAEQAYYMNDGKLKPCTVNADGSFNAVDNANELALIPGKYDFYAITPALPLNADKKTVTVPNGVDYASSVTSNITVSSDQTQTLTQLSRKCAKIALVVNKSVDNTEMDALKLNPEGKGVVISVLPASQSITLNTDITAATGTTMLTIPASAFTLNGTTSTATTYLLPRLGTNRMKIDYDLTYTVSGTEESKTVSGTMGNTVLEKGKSYTFTLTMRKTGASLTVIDWIENNQEVVTGESLDYTDNGKGWFLIAAGDAINPDLTAADPKIMDWYKATGTPDVTYNPGGKYKACPDGWRPPSKSDGQIMWIYEKAMPKYHLTTGAMSDYCFTMDDSDDTACWGIGRTGGTTEQVSKSSLKNLRCVREVVSGVKRYPYVANDASGKATAIVSRDDAGGVEIGAIHPTWQVTPVHTYLDVDNSISAVFIVATNDCNAANTPGIAQVNNTYLFSDVNKACAAYSEQGSTEVWRAPTQREVMLINQMHSRNLLTGVDTPTETYWASTSGFSNYGWVITMETGKMIQVPTTYHNKVRCVRDADLTVASSTLVADYAQWGNSFTKSIAFNSIGGTVSVKSINNGGADKNWLTSAVISRSGTSGQVQITYKPTTGNAGVHNDVTITLVNQAGTTQTITVKYDNGFIPSSVLSANGWATNLPTSGAQIAKKGNILPSATADANWDNELMQWTSSSTNVPLAREQGCGKGAINTTNIIAALGADGVAASKCRSLGPNWYLPTLKELIVVRACLSYFGASYAFNKATINDYYWSSSEQADGPVAAWRLPMYTTGNEGSTNTKTEKNYVRAMMNL